MQLIFFIGVKINAIILGNLIKLKMRQKMNLIIIDFCYDFSIYKTIACSTIIQQN